MSGSETVPILVNTSVADSALSASESSEDIRLVPDVAFEPTLDSPGLNRESQPLLGGFDVSYNQFQGEVLRTPKAERTTFTKKKFNSVNFAFNHNVYCINSNVKTIKIINVLLLQLSLRNCMFLL